MCKEQHGPQHCRWGLGIPDARVGAGFLLVVKERKAVVVVFERFEIYEDRLMHSYLFI